MFIRADQNTIINTDYIVTVTVEGNKLTAKMTDGTEVEVDNGKLTDAIRIINTKTKI